MNGLLDFLQAASNSAAGTVSGPVDLIGMGLRKLGVPVPQNSLLSSEWMKQKGLMADTPQNAASLAGETFGLLSPVVAAAKAPQIARGLLAMGENAAAPSMLGKMGQRGGVDVSYRGGHTAPTKARGNAPLHDLTVTYPDDIYSHNASRYYGHYGDARDNYSVHLMQQAKGNPDMPVTMYRAVPKYITPAEQIAKIEKDLAKYQTRRIVPKEFGGSRTKIGDEDGFLKWAATRLEELKKLPPGEKVQINNGDWVTISPAYAKEHAMAQFGSEGRILKKTVPARKLFTDGNSIHEFGYDESGRAALGALGLLGLGSGGLIYAGQKD